MAKTIGKITFENGSFFIKHPDGTLEVAKVGAMLSEGDVIIGSSSNSNSNLIRVSLIDNSSEIQVVGSNEQLFDITLLSGEIPEDTVVPNSQVGDLLEQATNNQQDPNQNNEQATLTLAQIENLDAAAAGADQTTTEPVGIVPLRLEDRTAGETNVVTDLRDAEETLAVIDDTVDVNNTVLVDAVLTLNDITVQEGSGSATISASLDQTPRTVFVVTLSNGATITFGTDYVPGTLIQSTPFEIQGDDVYIDKETYTVSVVGITGGGFNILTTSTSTIIISDTIDEVKVTLTASTEASEDGGTITYTASLPTGVVAANDITVTLSVGANGEPASDTNPALTITIEAGDSFGTETATVSRDNNDGSGEDKFNEVDSLSASITNAVEANAGTTGSLENLTWDTTAQVTTITNDLDEVKVTLTASTEASEDGGTITYTASLPTGVVAANDITVTLSVGANGEPASDTNPALTITIEAGDSFGTETATVSRDNNDGSGEDKFNEVDSLSASITNAVEANAGTTGSLENLTWDTTAQVTTITNDSDTTTATITVNITNAETTTAVISVEMSNPPQTVGTVVYVKPDTSDTLLAISIGVDGTGSLDLTAEQVALFANDEGSLTVSYDHIVGGNYEKVEGNIATDNIPNIATPAIGDDAEVTGDTAIGTTLYGSLNFDFGDDGAATTDSVKIIYNGGLGMATTETGVTKSGTTDTFTVITGYSETLADGSADTTSDPIWVLEINEVTGAYSFTQLENYIHNTGDDVASGLVTVVITDADGDTTSTQLQLNITDDVPEVTVEDVIIHREQGTTSSTITFDSGADENTLLNFIESNGTLTWDNMVSGYTFNDITPVGTTDSIIYAAQYTKADGTTGTYFTVTVNSDSTYDFYLNEPAPIVSTNSGELFGSIVTYDTIPDSANKTDIGIIADTNFGGAFKIEMKGYTGGTITTVNGIVTNFTSGTLTTISKDTTIGVADDTVQSSQKDSMRFDIIQNTGFETTTLSNFTIVASSTAGLKADSDNNPSTVYIAVHYTNGDVVYVKGSIGDEINSKHIIDFDIDATKTVDYVELVPIDTNLKVVGVSLAYTTVTNPSDIPLYFTLSGEDTDGDTATASFNATLISGTSDDDSGSDKITTGSSNDTVSGGDGDDEIYTDGGDDIVNGGAGADILDGGTGNDTLSYATDRTGVNVNLSTNTVSGGDAQGDVISNFENVTGGSGNDIIIGDANANIINGGAGDDYLDGESGADTISGGAGNDTIVYDGQDVSIYGGSGIDTLVLSGNDSIDFSNVNQGASQTISSIENIDLTASGTQSISNLTLADVIQLTQDQVDSNGNHILKITGSGTDNPSSPEDSVHFNLSDGVWKYSGPESIEGVDYNVYTNDTDPTYKVAIANVDDVNITNS